MKVPIELYPVVIYEDRYGGVYSGGEWIAVGGGQRTDRNLLDIPNGPFDGDFEAGDWGANLPDWAAVGATPDEAVKVLIEKFFQKMDKVT